MEQAVERKPKYPLGFWICSLTYSFERFAFYGSKPLLVLFLITAVNKGGLGISEAQGAMIAANFTAITYIAPVIGGWVCDRFLGARYAVSLGCLLMGLGYLFGWKATSTAGIYAMIGVVSMGSGLFKGNLSGIIGRLFEDQELLDTAFSVQYSFVNIGAFFGSLITGYLYLNTFKAGEVLGFRPVFLVCAALVIIGGIFFTLMWGTLQGQGKKPFKYLTDVNGNIIGESENESDEELKKEAVKPLTQIERNRVVAIVFVSFISIIFWLFYYQQEIALTIYMTKFVNMNLGSIEIAPQHVTTTWNGLLCIFLSLAAAKLWATLAKRPQGDLSMFHKVALAFLFLGVSYVTLMAMEITRGIGASEASKASVLWIFLFGTFLTIGEICFSPLGNSFISKWAPKKYLSLLLGVWLFASFAASIINGYLQIFVEKLGIYSIFVTFAIVSFITAAIIFLMTKKLTKLLGEDEE
ncbi:MAG: peptide MFS transporter [Peptostreptococcus porci]|uniref:Peptide MFS transporter n=1 Tax=Peptostreptococcus porci TaxID=2652282 RepID=A0A6N7XEP7_9FIRM|nr:peptide MFS transporter [Peptostreptococcus porci]MDD7182886.1 peptide MFS transporter [Peptostreptococcus porci]MDY2794305.1 peptide MFS transporter [Peptostreptococcus porci]MDY4560261.1 peptide MFS transporter [Peptostreptococcus porci]MDY5480663.1 peptide MFS transporter [Peptostreptococcus porci]MDY5964386.1 peptide MFS transporter [Peptostreptococcus porci]